MAKLKNSFQHISDDSKQIAYDYLKLFSMNQIKRLAILLGVLLSVFVLSILLLIVIVFCSFTLAEYLNELMQSRFWGYLIIAGLYLLIIISLIWKMIRSSQPMFTNLLIKFLISIFDIELSEKSNIDGLKHEIKQIESNIDKNKTSVTANVKMLKYEIIESLIKDLLGLFNSKKNETDKGDQGNPKSKENQ